jgi:hypothetical protein
MRNRFTAWMFAGRMRWILLGVLMFIIAVRASLPFIVKSYVNKTLDEIPGYKGHVDDIDINLWRGAYEIEGLRLDKVDGDIPVPFFSARKLDLSIEWGALLNGALVGEIEFEEPKLNFVHGPTAEESQRGDNADFIEPAKELFPVKINRFDVVNGEVHFRNFQSDPKVDIYIDSLFVHATNLTNSEDLSENLVASIDGKGRIMGSGRLTGHLDLDPYAKLPTFNLDFQLENVPLPKLNDFFKAYASVDVESGTFNVSGEMAAVDGEFTGYVKPLFHNMQVLDVEDDIKTPLRFVWEAVVEGVTSLFSNTSTDNLGTKVPLSGKLSDPRADILSTIGGLLKNAFIKALQPGIEGTITLEGVEQGATG